MKENEKPFFSMTKLHLVFALSSFAFLATTFWMIADDHFRPWKRYQTRYRNEERPQWRNLESLQEEVVRASGENEEGAVAEGMVPLGSDAFVDRLPATPLGSDESSGLPLIDAWFRPVSIRQQWLPSLPLDYHFGPVERLDRCRTCHLGITRRIPSGSDAFRYWGMPVDTPLLREKGARIKLVPGDSENEYPWWEQTFHGMLLAPEHLVASNMPTVGAILPGSPASKSRLLPGDRILSINGKRTTDVEIVKKLLNSPPSIPASASDAEGPDLEEEKAIFLDVVRGRSEPFATHPRQDLMVGGQSPHPVDLFGCTICHGGQSLATDMSRAAHMPNGFEQGRRWKKEYYWEFDHHATKPMLPERFLQSRCLTCHVRLTSLVDDRTFDSPPAAKLVAGYRLVRRYGCFGCHRIDGYDADHNRVGVDLRLAPPTLEEIEEVPEEDVPGQMQKIGPPLKAVATRMTSEDIIRWTKRPDAILPGAKMPRFFGLFDHLSPQERRRAALWEAVELDAMAHYLVSTSTGLPETEPAKHTTDLAPPSANRGRYFFQSLGCTACHRHEDFPAIETLQGGDLSGLDRRFSAPDARRWFAAWLRQPSRFAPRTLMPNMSIEIRPIEFLVPGDDLPENGETVHWCDPVLDITEFLFQETEPLETIALPASNSETRDELAIAYLSLTRPREAAKKIWQNGFSRSGDLRPVGAESLLFSPLTEEKRWRYLGKETLLRRGCFGCHDLPGIVEAAEIGPELTGWSEKHPSLLGFDQVEAFLEKEEVKDSNEKQDHAYFLQAIADELPMGFLWQKLRRPRSFDYRLAGEKEYLDWLRMGRFDFTDRQREQIMTFVLGLSSDPPPLPYRDVPEGNRKALAQGRELLDRYGCDGCHIRAMGKWRFTLRAEEFERPPEIPSHAFMKPEIAPEKIEASLRQDLRKWNAAEIVGRAMHDDTGKVMVEEDWDGHSLFFITPWQPTVIGGAVWPVGEVSVPVSEPSIYRHWPAVGGSAARALYPVVVDRALTSDTSASFMEAWGWLPPPLIREGEMIRPDWLFRYLMRPTVIRPASVMRMPQFHLSEEEATRLVRYFMAVERRDSPFTEAALQRDIDSTFRRPMEEIEAQALIEQPKRLERLDQAFALVQDRTTYCMKCHLLGSLEPEGSNPTVLAPDLAGIAQRMRPQALRRWIANPKSILPYTAMPVNFPPEQEMGQDILPGSSLQQLNAVCDLLLNFDAYLAVRHLSSLENRAEGVEPGGE